MIPTSIVAHVKDVNQERVVLGIVIEHFRRVVIVHPS